MLRQRLGSLLSLKDRSVSWTRTECHQGYVPAVAGLMLVGQQAGAKVAPSCRRWLWRRLEQGGVMVKSHVSAANASLQRWGYYFWSPTSGLVAKKRTIRQEAAFSCLGRKELGEQRYRPGLSARADPQASFSQLPQTTRARFDLCSCCVLVSPFSWKMSFPQAAGCCGNAGEEEGGSSRLNPSGLVSP